MELLDWRRELAGGDVRLKARIRRAGQQRPEELYVAVPERHGELVADEVESLVPALLVPCMQAGEPLVIPDEVSPRLLAGAEAAQQVLRSWYPALSRVEIRARARPESPRPSARGCAAFFSGGVDSFYTALGSLDGTIHEPRLTHLLYVRAFGLPIEQGGDVDRTQADMEAIARELGLELVPISTDLTSHFPIKWDAHYHGAAMASVALALSRGIGRVLVSASFFYPDLIPWGSHPLLDPLWSTEWLEVRHVGAEARRSDKLKVLARSALALRSLNVCLAHGNRGGPANCGRCTKCVRTMVALEILGLLDRTPRFPARLPAGFAGVLARDKPECREELLCLAREMGAASGRLASVLESLQRRLRRRQALRALIETLPALRPLLVLFDGLRRRRSRQAIRW